MTTVQDSQALPGVARRTLDNGLQVVVVPDHTAPVVGVNLMYAVGSRDEKAGRTGFAHLFEHLMFQGSESVAAGELSASLSRVGGMPNATTSFDRTTYFVTVPVGALELALWLEADRMGGMLAALDQKVLDNERLVVKNERRERMDNAPYGTAWELLFAELFPPEHPYHWLPIGSMADIEAATLEDVHAFFQTHYGPNNAVLTMAGDLTTEDGFALAERYFGGIPANPRIPATTGTQIGRIEQERRVLAPEPGPLPAVYASYRGPAQDSPELAALDVACFVLGGGPASRLVDRLVRREQVAQAVQSDVDRLLGEVSVVHVVAHLTGLAGAEEYERIRDEEIARLATDGPTDEEVATAVAQLERQLWEQVSTVDGMAEVYGEAQLFRPGPDPLDQELADLATVTPEAVRAAVATWLDPANRVVLTYEGGAYEDLEEYEGLEGLDDLPGAEMSDEEPQR